MGLKEWQKGIKKEIKKEKRGKNNNKKKKNKNEVEEPRFQMNKFKLEKNLSDSRRMRGQRDWSRKISCSYYKIVIGSAYVW